MKSKEKKVLEACKTGSAEKIKKLLKNGFKKNSINLDVQESILGKTPLMFASEFGHIAIIESLLNNGADINFLNKNDETALILSLKNNKADVARFLIQKNADVFAKDTNDRTTLHLATILGLEDIVKIIITKGVDINHKDFDKFTALDYATINEFKKIEELLIQKGANVNKDLSNIKKTKKAKDTANNKNEEDSSLHKFGNRSIRPSIAQYAGGIGLVALGIFVIFRLNLFELIAVLLNGEMTPANKGSVLGTIIGSIVGLYFIVYKPAKRLLTTKRYSDLLNELDDSKEQVRSYAGKLLEKQRKKGIWAPINITEEMKFYRSRENWKEILDKGDRGIEFVIQSLNENKGNQALILKSMEENNNEIIISTLIDFISESSNDSLNSKIMKSLKKITGEDYNDIESWVNYKNNEQVKNNAT